MGRPLSSGCNCQCEDGTLPPPPPATSGACCYLHATSGWICEEWLTEDACNALKYSNFGLGKTCSTHILDGCNSCFTAGSEVLMSDGAIKFIEDVQEGDRVVSISGVYNTVIKPIRTVLGDRKLVSINCGKPFITEDHPIMTEEGFKSFNYCRSLHRYPHVKVNGELGVGEKIRTTGEYEKLHTFDLIEGDKTLPLYNLELDGDHTYFVEGYGVHNKTDPCDYYTGPDPCPLPPPPLPSGTPGSGQYCGGFGEVDDPLGIGTAFTYQYTWPNGTGQFDASGIEIFTDGTIGGFTATSSAVTDLDPSYEVTVTNSNGDTFIGGILNCFAKASGYCNEVVISDGIISVTGDFCLNVSGVPYTP